MDLARSSILPAVLLAFSFAIQGSETGDEAAEARSRIDSIEAIQQPLEDFRCEFEGLSRYSGQVAARDEAKLGPDGLYQSFSGLFVWKRGGDVYSDSLHRRAAENQLERVSLVVMERQGRSQRHARANDGAIGNVTVDSTRKLNAWNLDSLGSIFLIDQLKRDVSDEALKPSVSDDVEDGKSLKRLDIRLNTPGGTLIRSYWIDLSRFGHVVKHESYVGSGAGGGSILTGRQIITLAAFRVGGTDIWMPISGETIGYGAADRGRFVATSEPTSFASIKVLDGTMEFNKRPPATVFSLKYKAGTPISDNLRRLKSEYGRQELSPNPSRAEVEAMLNQQVADAESQRTELVAAVPSSGLDGSVWFFGLAGLAVVASLGMLWWRRHAT